MNIANKLKAKTFITLFCTLLMCVFLMNVSASKEASAATSYETLRFSINGDSTRISGASVKKAVENADWLTVTAVPGSMGDTYTLTVSSASNVRTSTGTRTATVKLYDAINNGNVVKEFTIIQTCYTTVTIPDLKITSFKKHATLVPLNQPAKLEVVASGYGTLTYEWWYKNPGKDWIKSGMYQGSTYECKMFPEKNGQIVKCKVIDAKGRSKETEVVTLYHQAAITQQPEDVWAQNGTSTEISVTAIGNDLKYQWYIKNPGNSSFTKVGNNGTDSSYTCTMSAGIDGRKAYCIVTDRFGKTAKTNEVTYRSKIMITKQPTNAFGYIGNDVRTQVIVSGKGPFEYNWYVRDPGQRYFTLSSKNIWSTYSYTMSKATNGREVYCIVKDAHGKQITSNTVKLSIPKHSCTVYGAPRTTKNATCTSEGKKVAECKYCAKGLYTISIPKKAHNYVFDKTTFSVDCSMCKKSYASNNSVTYEEYVKKSKVTYSALSQEQKENIAKSYLAGKGIYGLDSSSVTLIMEAGKFKNDGNKLPILNLDDIGYFTTVLDRCEKVSTIFGVDKLATFFSYTALGSHAAVFLTTADGSFDNAEDSIQSIVNLSSACFSVINPYVGVAYEKIADELAEELKDVVKIYKGRASNIAITNAIESIDGFEDYSSLADRDIYYKAVVAINQFYRNSGYGLASAIAGYTAEEYVDFYIYQELNKDIENLTGYNMEELAKVIG